MVKWHQIDWNKFSESPQNNSKKFLELLNFNSNLYVHNYSLIDMIMVTDYVIIT